MWKALWVMYTVVHLSFALVSIGPPFSTKCETSAMWTPISNSTSPPGVCGSITITWIASSRSLAVAGSMVIMRTFLRSTLFLHSSSWVSLAFFTIRSASSWHSGGSSASCISSSLLQRAMCASTSGCPASPTEGPSRTPAGSWLFSPHEEMRTGKMVMLLITPQGMLGSAGPTTFPNKRPPSSGTTPEGTTDGPSISSIVSRRVSGSKRSGIKCKTFSKGIRIHGIFLSTGMARTKASLLFFTITLESFDTSAASLSKFLFAHRVAKWTLEDPFGCSTNTTLPVGWYSTLVAVFLKDACALFQESSFSASSTASSSLICFHNCSMFFEYAFSFFFHSDRG
mmetsp:Transcript_37840/g.74416  ORF Transcript_37840/g.74416 Transcript_37840/m.74416 type:complete len:340 (-) Transcript_37840:122-1141(-)